MRSKAEKLGGRTPTRAKSGCCITKTGCSERLSRADRTWGIVVEALETIFERPMAVGRHRALPSTLQKTRSGGLDRWESKLSGQGRRGR